ncbi:hypothetical protein [Bosea sp. AAP35]|nr:hypothetical protein [Bosea sp. AAP35]
MIGNIATPDERDNAAAFAFAVEARVIPWDQAAAQAHAIRP